MSAWHGYGVVVPVDEGFFCPCWFIVGEYVWVEWVFFHGVYEA